MEKQEADYAKLLTEAEPIFKLSRYHEDFVTRSADVTTLDSRSVYFVIKDVADKRYGEYSLLALERSPINVSLTAFLAKKLTMEMAKHDK